ncbi:MAG: D-aminoacylase [Chloroflexi bacterium]|nr:D-aminoacylase [Chloroflexota bacterium]
MTELTFPFDLILRGGTVIDGTGAPARRADVGIVGDKVAAIGDLTSAQAARVIDATHRYITPGFIDVHTHTDETIFINPKMESKIHQGVTTEVSGNCGYSAAPVHGAARDDLLHDLDQYKNITLDWQSMGEYLARIEKMGISTNYVTLVGQGTLRASVMGYAMREPTPDELATMKNLLAQAIDEGAWGLSTGLIYPPSSYASMDELVALSRVAAERGGIYTSHIRNEGDRLLESVEEALTIGERAGIRVQLSHHKAAGKRNWGKVHESLARIEQARERGIHACADQYPYVASSTGLGTVIPDWAHEGGWQKLVERLGDVTTRERIAEDVRTARPGWENPAVDSGWHNIVIVGCKSDRSLQGKTAWDIAQMQGKDVVQATFDLLIANEGSVQVVIFSMSEDDVKTVVSVPWVSVGSDSTARAPQGPMSNVQCHPRTYGTFPRLLSKYVREDKVLTWETAIAKMTSAPAQMFGLNRRGELREGYFADMVVFDPERIADTATFTEPHQFPIGFDYVLVNGTPTIEFGKHTEARAGKVLRK